jgi:DNA-directed RNA polymerase specialized sigma24 family protein
MKDSRSRKKDWSLTPEAFDELLRRLGPDEERAGLKYEEIRRGLELFFRSKGCHGCAELADKTIDRGAKRISEGVKIQTSDPAAYFIGIAKKVLYECFRRQTLPAPTPLTSDHHKLECRERCFRTLDDKARSLLGEYCEGDYAAGVEHHREMARRLGITANALRLRILNHRAKLAECMKTCLEEKESEDAS